MSLRRFILLCLLILPLGMVILSIFWSSPGFELAFLVLGVPIGILTVWEISFPELLDGCFGKPRAHLEISSSDAAALMKNKYIFTLVFLFILGLLLMMPVLGYASLRASVDRVSFSFALFTIVSKLGSKLWHFLTIPAIFISLLVFILLAFFMKPLLTFIAELNKGQTRGAPSNLAYSRRFKVSRVNRGLHPRQTQPPVSHSKGK